MGSAPTDRARLAGRAIGWLLLAFLILDAGIKLVPIQPVLDTLAALGWPNDPATARALGLGLLAIAALYAHSRFAPLGAVLLTGYLGGAVATHERIGSPLLTHTLFGVYLGAAAWASLWLRDPRLRAILSTTRGERQ